MQHYMTRSFWMSGKAIWSWSLQNTR